MTTINVTAEHIAKGKRDSCELCPIALAIADAGLGPVWVDNDRATFGTREQWFDVELPGTAMFFIEAFDNGYHSAAIQPFTFELDYPAAVTS